MSAEGPQREPSPLPADDSTNADVGSGEEQADGSSAGPCRPSRDLQAVPGSSNDFSGVVPTEAPRQGSSRSGSEEQLENGRWAAPRQYPGDLEAVPGSSNDFSSVVPTAEEQLENGQWAAPRQDPGDLEAVRGPFDSIYGIVEGADFPEFSSVIRFQFPPFHGRRSAWEGTWLLVFALGISLVSFGFLALFFHVVLRVPARIADLPPGYKSWTSCREGEVWPAATALGRVLPYNKVRALVSLPKIYEVALICLSLVILTAGRQRWRTCCIAGLALFSLAIASTPVYVFADAMGIIVLPQLVDPAVTFSMLLVIAGVLAYAVIQARPSATSVLTRCPKLAFFFGLVLLFSLNTVLVNILSALEAREVNSLLVVSLAIAFIRGSGLAIRYVFRSLGMPYLACFAMLFSYDISVVLSLRRYWFYHSNLLGVALAALTSAALELFCNCISSAYAVHTYNTFMRTGCQEKAVVQINLFFTSVVSELIAEHVALHSLVGYHLFLDPRVLSLKLLDKAPLFAAWLVSFSIELITDIITMVPMLGFLPVSMSNFMRGQPLLPAALFLLCASIHAHVIGLHSYLDQDRYFCGHV